MQTSPKSIRFWGSPVIHDSADVIKAAGYIFVGSSIVTLAIFAFFSGISGASIAMFVPFILPFILSRALLSAGLVWLTSICYDTPITPTKWLILAGTIAGLESFLWSIIAGSLCIFAVRYFTAKEKPKWL